MLSPSLTASRATLRAGEGGCLSLELDGATLLFPTSFGYFDPHILAMAKEYPNVQFFHAGTLWKEGMPNNVGSYFALVDEGQYLAGRVAAATSG